jgi:hypothetical protein
MPQTATTAKRSPRAPFEEPILVKYSPHHEFPLSTVSSLAIHCLAIVLLIIGGILLARLNWASEGKPVASDAVVTEEPRGGGGGHPDGVGKNPGDGAIPPPDAEAALLNQQQVVDPQKRTRLDEAKKDVLTLPEFKDDPSRDIIEGGGRAVDAWLNLKKEVRAKLDGAIAGKGDGGSGSGGGEGTGRGPGKGSGVGPGRGNRDRANRVLRWTLIFNTRDGQDYLRQIDAFGGIIAVPDPKDPDNYLVIRDLKERPARPQAEDIAKIQRIYWIDDKEWSVKSMGSALGLAQVPSHFVVFFPVEFEQRLLDLELKYRNKQEHEIVETRFDVRRAGGTYEPVVISQR